MCRRRGGPVVAALGGGLQQVEYLGRVDEVVVVAELQLALDNFLIPPKEIIIIEPKGEKGSSSPLLDKIRRQYLPGRILSVAAEGHDRESQAQIIPLMKYKSAFNDPTAYVCENKTCQTPTDDPEIFAKQLAE